MSFCSKSNKRKLISKLTGKLTLILLFAAAGNLAYPCYMLAKEQVGQHLLNRAWQKAKTQVTTIDAKHVKHVEQVKPWPWADIFPIGQLSFANNEQHIVLNNDSGQALAFGPGLHGFSLGNQHTSIISAHNDSSFRHLKEVKINEQISFERLGQKKVNYQVQHIEIIDRSKQQLSLESDILNTHKSLILVTCYPFNQNSGNSPLRYLVYAQQIKS